MVYLIFSALTIFSSLVIIRNRDIFFNCPARIETFSIAFSASRLAPVKAVDRFSAVYSVSARSRV
jgi:hypothetical protein